jgi:hypothetical protein
LCFIFLFINFKGIFNEKILIILSF